MSRCSYSTKTENRPETAMLDSVVFLSKADEKGRCCRGDRTVYRIQGMCRKIGEKPPLLMAVDQFMVRWRYMRECRKNLIGCLSNDLEAASNVAVEGEMQYRRPEFVVKLGIGSLSTFHSTACRRRVGDENATGWSTRFIASDRVPRVAPKQKARLLCLLRTAQCSSL